MKGKGVVGATWEDSRRITRDIDAIRVKASSQAAFEGLAEDETMSLTWEEFQKTPHYSAVSGSPLYRRTGDGSQIRGVLAIDFLAGGHFDELVSATENPGSAGVIGVCEASL